jgi:transposase
VDSELVQHLWTPDAISQAGDREMKKQATKTPREARTFDEVCGIPRDNVTRGQFWMLLDDDHIVLTQQKPGEPATASIRITRRAFEAFADWYNDGVWPRRKKP